MPLFEQLNLELARGQSLALLGESGSGKSTLLHLIAGLDHADSGIIQIADYCVTEMHESALAGMRRHDVALVFQQFHLISTLNIFDNIRFQALLCDRQDSDYENELIERLGLGTQLKKMPHQLSRGQQQRVAIARALLHKPMLLLADEPTGNLDENASLEVMTVFCELVKQSGCTLLMVTHSHSMAEFLDSRLQLHNGKLETL